ncbi:dihydroorotase family protein [Amycolatopsis sp. GM8]|uniref:dihydroorotase n=1 Tax=Amycolatopsis sp. GM8 TaxID=2896530 RepID=UPI001F33E98B|nr:amidohydrolase family protein [Amycolatopsis sp. GM8]
MTTIPAATLTVVRGGLLPDRPDLGPVDVLISGGRITQVAGAGTLDAPARLDIGGAWLLPGFVDAHVHPIHAETLASVGDAAPASGITTVLDHFYPQRDESLRSAVERAGLEAARGAADHGFHVRITPDRVGSTTGSGERLRDQLRHIAAVPGVVSVKAFMSHADPAVMVTPSQLTLVLHDAADAGLPVVVHAEPGDVLAVLDSLSGSAETLSEHDRRRAPDLEAAAVSLAAAAARAVGARLYVAHLSSEVAVAALRRARQLGTSVRGESCAHYMTLDSGAPLGSLGRVTPPLRSTSSVEAMRRLAADPHSGIDVLASDHCGYVAEEKPLADFAQAGNGLPGLDSLVPLLLDGAIGEGWLTPSDIVRLASRGPADTFGLVTKGRIEPGCDADLVVVDPGGTTTLRTQPPGPATAQSPYGEMSLRGAITDVLRRGVAMVRDSEATEATTQGGGMPVERKEPVW